MEVFFDVFRSLLGVPFFHVFGLLFSSMLVTFGHHHAPSFCTWGHMAPTWDPKGPKWTPRGAKMNPKGSQMDLQNGQNGALKATDGGQRCQNGAKKAPQRTKRTPKSVQNGARRLSSGTFPLNDLARSHPRHATPFETLLHSPRGSPQNVPS